MARKQTDETEVTHDALQRATRTGSMETASLAAMQDRLQQEQAQAADRERLIAQCHEVIGRVQAADVFSKMATVSSLVWLREMKEAKIYKDLPNIGTWDNFCKYLGKDRRTVDEDLQNLSSFGENFLETCRQLSIGYRELRQLRQLTHNGDVVIDGEVITIGEKKIPFDPDHTDDLQAAIEWILDEKSGLAQRVEKLEKNMKAVVKEETKGLRLEKDALVKEVERLKVCDITEKDRDWSVGQMDEIKQAIVNLELSCRKFMVDPRLVDDRPLQAQIEGHLTAAEMLLKDLRTEWEQAFYFGEEE